MKRVANNRELAKPGAGKSANREGTGKTTVCVRSLHVSQVLT